MSNRADIFHLTSLFKSFINASQGLPKCRKIFVRIPFSSLRYKFVLKNMCLEDTKYPIIQPNDHTSSEKKTE